MYIAKPEMYISKPAMYIPKFAIQNSYGKKKYTKVIPRALMINMFLLFLDKLDAAVLGTTIVGLIVGDGFV